MILRRKYKHHGRDTVVPFGGAVCGYPAQEIALTAQDIESMQNWDAELLKEYLVDLVKRFGPGKHPQEELEL